jgi:hypothetical protein
MTRSRAVRCRHSWPWPNRWCGDHYAAVSRRMAAVQVEFLVAAPRVAPPGKGERGGGGTGHMRMWRCGCAHVYGLPFCSHRRARSWSCARARLTPRVGNPQPTPTPTPRVSPPPRMRIGWDWEGVRSGFRPNKPIVDQNYAWYSGLSSGFACATPCT